MRPPGATRRPRPVLCKSCDVGKIVGIHGIAQQYKGGNELRAEWLPAIEDGLIAAGRRDLSEAVREEDLRVSFFGNLFRPRGAMGAEFAPYLCWGSP